MLDDDTVARKISAHLGRQPEVSAHVAYRLSQARASALMRVDAPRRAWTQRSQWPSRRMGAAIALAMLWLGYVTWQINSASTDFADLDAELLTYELPPAAYLDPGFVRVVAKIGK